MKDLIEDTVARAIRRLVVRRGEVTLSDTISALDAISARLKGLQRQSAKEQHQ